MLRAFDPWWDFVLFPFMRGKTEIHDLLLVPMGEGRGARLDRLDQATGKMNLFGISLCSYRSDPIRYVS